MTTPSYRVFTKRKLTEDPTLKKGYRKKTKRQQEIDQDEKLKAKYISQQECKLLDNILDEQNQIDQGD